jgi:hypothetical protein
VRQEGLQPSGFSRYANDDNMQTFGSISPSAKPGYVYCARPAMAGPSPFAVATSHFPPLVDLTLPGTMASGSYGAVGNIGTNFYTGSAAAAAAAGPSGSSSTNHLADLIGWTSNYDLTKMTDGFGNPLSSRLTSYIDDVVNDPRKTSQEIKELLSNIRPDMEIPEEERGQTPEGLRYGLYLHQQLALKWMTDMETGTNKGGILADDMGLGKTISMIALMVSRKALDNVKVCVTEPACPELCSNSRADQSDRWPGRTYQAVGERD